MASYQGHLAFSSVLGAAYGTVAAFQWDLDWGVVFLGAGLTSLAGMLPDLDSHSSVPVRELFSLAAAATPFLLVRRVMHHGFSMEQTLVILFAVYLLVRYGVSTVFKRLTVHRGMFHSIPGMLIAGFLVFLGYHNPDTLIRLYLAGGVVLGFFSHLFLDKLCGVDLMGFKVHLKKHAGSPLKLFSSSWPANLATYGLLAALVYVSYLEFNPADAVWRSWHIPKALSAWRH